MSDILTIENLVKPLAKGVMMFQPKQSKFLVSVDMEVRTDHPHNPNLYAHYLTLSTRPAQLIKSMHSSPLLWTSSMSGMLPSL